MIDAKLAEQCLQLNEDRQRIHAGRFLDTAISLSALDIRPSEAEAAVLTVHRLVHAAVKWVSEH